MNFLFTLTYYDPHISGLTQYVKTLSEELTRNGHSVDILCMQHDQSPSTDHIFRAIPLIRVNKGFISIDWISKLITLNKKHKIVFINLPQLEGALAALLFRITGKKVISIYHCDILVPNPIIQFVINTSTFVCLLLSNQIVSYTEDYASHSPILKRFLNKIVYSYPPVKI